MKLIGLTGAIGSGKSTVASLLCGKHKFEERTFKKPLVDCLSIIFHCDPAIFYDRETKEQPHPRLFGKTPREVMQSFGTDWARNSVYNDIWVDKVRYDLENNVLKVKDNVVISDVRFENEAQMIKRLGGKIWKIERKDNPFIVETSHESEQGLDAKYIDVVINNFGNLLELSKVIDSALKSSYSILYAPDLMIQVTLSGQLSLLLLIESLELNGFEVVSGNTDGIVTKCK